MSWVRALALALLPAASGLALGVGLVRVARAQGAAPYAGLEALARALTTVEARSLLPLGAEALAHRAIGGIVDGIDPWSFYEPPAPYSAGPSRRSPDPGGTGATLERIGDRVVVARLAPDGPGWLGGMREGDVLVQVNGVPVDGSAGLARDALRGPIGHEVAVEVERDGQRLPLRLRLDAVIDAPVWAERTADGVGWLRVGAFPSGVAAQARAALDALQADGPLRGLVLDLRDNPGGRLDEAVPLADRFLRRGLIVEIVGRGGAVEERIDATDAPDDLMLPLVVLVDQDSASAAEVVAGALQAQGRARLLGMPTYGKGAIQQEFLLPDGGAMRLTVSTYRLEGGQELRPDAPLRPDVELGRGRSLSPELRALRDALREGAPDPAAAEERVAALTRLARPEHLLEDPPSLSGPLVERAARDPQLAAALALLR